MTVAADFLRMIGDPANRARVAISMIDTNASEDRWIWNGVNKPRTDKNRSAHAGLPLSRIRTASVIVAADTMMPTRILYSNGERNSTATASVRMASSAMNRVKLHFPGICAVGTGKAGG